MNERGPREPAQIAIESFFFFFGPIYFWQIANGTNEKAQKIN